MVSVVTDPLGGDLRTAGCPTPLVWRDVLQSVRRDGQPHRLVHEDITLSATTFGSGPPLYLLPGFFGDHELYALTCWLLREECCCVLVDPPDLTEQSRTSPADRLKNWATGLIRLADQLGHDRLRLYGPGFGGLLALQLLLDWPDRVATAVIQSGFARYRLSRMEVVLAGLACLSRRRIGEFRAVMSVQERNHRQWFPPFDSTRWEFYASNVGDTPARQCGELARLAGQIDLRPHLPRIATPVLLMSTEGDGAVSSVAQRELASGLPHCRMETIDNCGRVPFVTHPHRLVKLLHAHWEENS